MNKRYITLTTKPKQGPVLDSLKLARRESALLHRLVAPNLFTIFVSHKHCTQETLGFKCPPWKKLKLVKKCQITVKKSRRNVLEYNSVTIVENSFQKCQQRFFKDSLKSLRL